MPLPYQLNFIQQGQVWAFVGDSDSGHSAIVNSIQGKTVENVSLKHQFRNLSNTRDFYYQQRYNSSDSEDALTVQQHLNTISTNEGYWNINSVITSFHLEKLLSEQVIKLSNGETKRLLIASALIKNPDIITLDHPLTGLDTNTRREFSHMLQQISATGTLVVMATNPMEIPEAITHVAVMQNEKIIFKDEKHKFDPANFNFSQHVVINKEDLKDLVSFEHNSTHSTIIQMTNVNVEYDGRKILNNVNWHVRRGERWALTGPNGAGKSTLLMFQ